MRWMWIDRFVEFRSGERAVAIKNTTLSDPPCDGYLPALSLYPHALIIEGMAQTAGLLVGEAKAFKTRVVLAKVGKAEFRRPVAAGSQLRFEAKVEDIQEDGAIASGVVLADGELQGELELIFAHLDDRFPDPIFEPHLLLAMLRLFGVYDVGVDAGGDRLEPPEHLLIAEREQFA
ncbi:MAG: beta-hydroxyacyl-ACP dehydratase [Planctomycetales bacterium]|nr:beta-hydroxyacyl-ACP dehydratase [Planctomycetales bacterium]